MATAIISLPKAKLAREAQRKSEIKTSWAGRVPYLKPGRYADGMPLHEVEYLACKLILKPNRFRSRKNLFDFAKVLRAPADKCGVEFSTENFEDAPLKIREVLFVDTKDYRLYNNAFILRRRIPYIDGFPSGEPEIVFKYRHPDIQKAAETDVRPEIVGDYRVKFKCQALPLKDQLGGIRLLFSHNVQFPRSHVGTNDVFQFKALTKIFPALTVVQHSPEEEIAMVNNTIIEEVLQDIGSLDFGSGTQSEDERSDLAYPGRTQAADWGVRLPTPIRRQEAIDPRRDATGRALLPSAAVCRQGLDCAECHKDRCRVPSPWQCPDGSRVTTERGRVAPHKSAIGTKRTWPSALHMSAMGKADMTLVTMSADPKWAGVYRPRPEPPPVFTGS